MSITHIKKLLGTDSGTSLDRIVRHARDMGDLAQRLREVLPEEAQAQLLAANLREDGELVIICRSSSWASRLRFESDLLLTTARRTGSPGAARCTFRVGRPETGGGR